MKEIFIKTFSETFLNMLKSLQTSKDFNGIENSLKESSGKLFDIILEAVEEKNNSENAIVLEEQKTRNGSLGSNKDRNGLVK